MDIFLQQFAGAEREFRLRLGEVIDLETARDVSIGHLYQRFLATTYYAEDVRDTLRHALVGGGMSFGDAKKLVDRQMDVKPMMELGTLAGDIILQAMTGIKPSELEPEPEENDGPADKGEIFHALLQVGLSPNAVREIRYADYVSLIRASKGSKVEPPSEAEFEQMLREWEERNGGNDGDQVS